MSGYDCYVFFLCLIVFIELTVLLGAMLYYIVKQTLKAISHGLEDERIIKEYDKQQCQRPAVKRACKIVTAVVLVLLLIFFIFSLAVRFSRDTVIGDVPVPKVVMSDSMSRKHASNTYLTEHNLNDQFQTFDLILTHELPGEFELQLYDVVVYEYQGQRIIHRIIGIEEPNEKHPDCRHFLLRGDATKYNDEFPVLYSQMRAIYRGQRVPFIGSFFVFMQSMAGYLCIFLVIFAVIATPIVEKKLWLAKLSRLQAIGYIPAPENEEVEV